MGNNNIFDNQSIYRQYVNQNIDHYQRIENELSSLSDDDIKELIQFEPYIQANNNLSMIIQAEMLKMVRLQVNQHYEDIDNVVKSIQAFKKNKDKGNREFQDYIKNYSHMSYQDYIKMKHEDK